MSEIYKYDETDVILSLTNYTNVRRCIQLYDAEDGCPFAKGTVNIPDEYLDTDEVFIKNYSENFGMLDFLIENGIVSNPVRGIVLQHNIIVPVCKLLKTDL